MNYIRNFGYLHGNHSSTIGPVKISLFLFSNQFLIFAMFRVIWCPKWFVLNNWILWKISFLHPILQSSQNVMQDEFNTIIILRTKCTYWVRSTVHLVNKYWNLHKPVGGKIYLIAKGRTLQVNQQQEHQQNAPFPKANNCTNIMLLL